jgi:hypothetical protein
MRRSLAPSVRRAAALAGALSVLAPAAAAPAFAQGIQTPFFIARIRAVTPQCRDNPTAPVAGYVSGNMSGRPSRNVSFVGCFPDVASCESWRLFVSGQIEGHLIQNRCEMR